jgi:hypothetical protein
LGAQALGGVGHDPVGLVERFLDQIALDRRQVLLEVEPGARQAGGGGFADRHPWLRRKRHRRPCRGAPKP